MAEKLPTNFESEKKSSAPLAGQEEFAQKVKEARFTDRVALLGFKREEMTEQDISRLRKINEKIEEADSPWVVRVMDKLQRENLLDSFKPEDVEKLQKIAQEKGYNFQKEGIVSSQVKEMTSLFKEEKEKEKKAEEWQKTFHSGGTRTKERIGQATVKEEPPAEEKAKAWVFQRLGPEEAPVINVEKASRVPAEQKREKTHEEIARHLVENPAEALKIFKKGVGLKLEKAAIDFATFWKRAGAGALRGMILPPEKAVGYPTGEARRAIWAAKEYLLVRPGAKRLEKVLAIRANLEALKKSGAITEDQAKSVLEAVMKQYHDASSEILTENEAHHRWEEEKKKTLDAMKTFGHARAKLSRWSLIERTMAKVKKSSALEKRAKKVAEKL